jgi:hypothetical protein
MNATDMGIEFIEIESKDQAILRKWLPEIHESSSSTESRKPTCAAVGNGGEQA